MGYGCLKIEYLQHALDQMKERRISKEEAESCINDHTIEYTDKGGNPIYVASVKGRSIKVVVKKGCIDPIVVITAADKEE
jgi:hypothetical protein